MRGRLLYGLGVEAKPRKKEPGVQAYALEADQDPFRALRGLFAKALEWLGGQQAAGLTHGDLETQVTDRFWDLARQAVQDHLDLRAAGEQILPEVMDA